MMFVDASAIVAILVSETSASRLIAALPARGAITSPLAVFEAALALARIARQSPQEAHERVERFLARAAVEIVEIDKTDGHAAIAAFARFGKGRHPAGLNLGDCFAYAVAKGRGLPLLFVGNDFAQTDIPAASTAN